MSIGRHFKSRKTSLFLYERNMNGFNYFEILKEAMQKIKS